MDSSLSSKPTHISNRNKNDVDDTIVINEKINLTKNQYKVLNMICNSYEKSISKYMQEALVQSNTSDIEDGNLCDVLLKLNEDNKKKSNSPSPLLLTRLTMTEKIVT